MAKARNLWSAALLLGVTEAILSGQSVSFSEYIVPTQNSAPGSIALGPDGALWFTEGATGGTPSRIGTTTSAGVTTEYPLPNPNSGLYDICAGPDGALWFTEQTSNRIGRITTAGVVTEYPLPTANSQLGGITTGPDGALWFTEGYYNKIGRITTAGAVTEYPLPTAGGVPEEIAVGPDGALWFGDGGNSSIGRITTTGAVSRYPIPSGGHGWRMTPGPDGALWFTEPEGGDGNKVGRITTAGAVTEYATPVPRSPAYITPGPDGALWFTETGNIGRITTAGLITEYPLPTTPFQSAQGIVTGSDGAIWYADFGFSKIGRVAVSNGLSSIAQLASGGYWTTTITLVNTGAAPTSCSSCAGAPAQVTLHFFDNNGNPLQLPLTFPQGSYSPVAASTFTGTVKPGAELVIASTGPSSQSPQVGWAELLTTGNVSGFAVFMQAVGSSLQEAVVPLESRTPGGFVLSFDNTTNHATGVALANIATQSASVGIVIRDDDGTVLLTGSITLPAQGHSSFDLATNYPISSQHSGTVEFDTPPNGQFSVLGLRFNPTGAFSSIPAVAR